MNRLRFVMTFVLAFTLLFVVTIFLSNAPVLAQPNAQATSTSAAAAQATETPAAAQDQTFVTLLPGAAGAANRIVVLTLKADGTAEMVTDPLGDEPAVTEVGTWEPGRDGVTLTLTGDGATTYATPIVIVFSQNPEGLVAASADQSRFGAGALTLYLRDSIEAKLASLKKAYVTLDLAAGFPLDPFLVSVNGGGELDASVLSADCHGYIDVNPSVSVNWSGTADVVRAFTYSDADPVLIVQTPDGNFHCGDDVSTLVLDSQVEIENPPAGIYNIWVGSAQPKQLLPTILVLTLRSDLSVSNFDLGSLVKRPAIPPSAENLPDDQQPAIVTDAVARFKGTVGGTLGATPLTQEISGEGTVAAFDLNLGNVTCNGYVGETPDYVFDVTSAHDQLAVFFEGEQDATLLVVGPDGAVQCNDDSEVGTNTNPSVVIENPGQGRYAVFVGRIDQEEPVEGTLTVTTDAQAVPQVLPPSE